MASRLSLNFHVDQRGRRKSQRRSSILKSVKPRPFDEIQNTSHDGYAKDRRVSFSNRIQIKEFVKGSTSIDTDRPRKPLKEQNPTPDLKSTKPDIQISTPTKADVSRRISKNRLSIDRLSIIPMYEESSSLEEDCEDFKPYSDMSLSPSSESSPVKKSPVSASSAAELPKQSPQVKPPSSDHPPSLPPTNLDLISPPPHELPSPGNNTHIAVHTPSTGHTFPLTGHTPTPSHYSQSDMELTLNDSPPFLVVPEISCINRKTGIEGTSRTSHNEMTEAGVNDTVAMSFTMVADESASEECFKPQPEGVCDANMEVDIESVGAEDKGQASVHVTGDTSRTLTHSQSKDVSQFMVGNGLDLSKSKDGSILRRSMSNGMGLATSKGTPKKSLASHSLRKSMNETNHRDESTVTSRTVLGGIMEETNIAPNATLGDNMDVTDVASCTLGGNNNSHMEETDLASPTVGDVTKTLAGTLREDMVLTVNQSGSMSLTGLEPSCGEVEGLSVAGEVTVSNTTAGNTSATYSAPMSVCDASVDIPNTSGAASNSVPVSFGGAIVTTPGNVSVRNALKAPSPMSFCDDTLPTPGNASNTVLMSSCDATVHTSRDTIASSLTTVSNTSLMSSDLRSGTPSDTISAQSTAVAMSLCTTPVVSASKPPRAPSSRSGRPASQVSTGKKFSVRSSLQQHKSPLKVHTITSRGTPKDAISTPLSQGGKVQARRTPTGSRLGSGAGSRVTRSSVRGMYQSHDMMMTESYVDNRPTRKVRGGSLSLSRGRKAKVVNHYHSFEVNPTEVVDHDSTKQEGGDVKTNHTPKAATPFILGVGNVAAATTDNSIPAPPSFTTLMRDEGNWLQTDGDSFILQSSNDTVSPGLTEAHVEPEKASPRRSGKKRKLQKKRNDLRSSLIRQLQVKNQAENVENVDIETPETVPVEQRDLPVLAQNSLFASPDTTVIEERYRNRQSLMFSPSGFNKFLVNLKCDQTVCDETISQDMVGSDSAGRVLDQDTVSAGQALDQDVISAGHAQAMEQDTVRAQDLDQDVVLAGHAQAMEQDVESAPAGHSEAMEVFDPAETVEQGVVSSETRDDGTLGQNLVSDLAAQVTVMVSDPVVCVEVTTAEGGPEEEVMVVTGHGSLLSSTFTVEPAEHTEAVSPPGTRELHTASTTSTSVLPNRFGTSTVPRVCTCSVTPPLLPNTSADHTFFVGKSHTALPSPATPTSCATPSVPPATPPSSESSTPPLSPVILFTTDLTGHQPPLDVSQGQGSGGKTPSLSSVSSSSQVHMTCREAFITHVHSLRVSYQTIAQNCQARLTSPEYLYSSSHPLFKSLLESILTRANIGLSLLTLLIDYGNLSGLARAKPPLPSVAAVAISEAGVAGKYNWMEAMHNEVEQKYADIQAVMVSAAEIYHWQMDCWSSTKVQVTVHNSAKITLTLEESLVSTYPQRIKRTNVRYVRGSLLFSKPQTEACMTTADIAKLLWTIIRYRGNS